MLRDSPCLYKRNTEISCVGLLVLKDEVMEEPEGTQTQQSHPCLVFADKAVEVNTLPI